MITTICKISYGSQTVPPIVTAVQGDTGRAINFEVSDFTPPAGATATYFILKPSGEAIYNSATIADNNILCELTAQSLAETGENRMQVRVLLGEDIVTSFEVILMVRKFLGDDAIESGTEMNIFDQAVEQAAEDFQSQAEQIVEGVIESIPADYTELTEEVDELNERLDAIDGSATAADVGMALKVKTVADGKVTEWEFGEAGGGGDTSGLINGYFTPPIAGTGNIDRNDGSVDTNSSYSYSDYVDISGYSKLVTRATQGSAFNAFYASDKSFISAFSVATGNDQTIFIPANAVYMRVSNSTSKYADTFVFKYLARNNVDKINDLKNTIGVLADQSLFIPLIDGTGYVSTTDGTIVASDTYSHSDYIDISDYDKLYVDGAVYNSSFNAFYASDKAFIDDFSVPVGSNTITIPANAVYMRVSASTAKFNDTFRFKSVGHSNAVRIGVLEEAVSDLEQDTDYFTPKIVSTGYISNNDGSEQVNANYSRSDYIDISRFGKLITGAAYDSAFNAFYTSAKVFIQSFVVRAGTDQTITPPSNAVYMRVSGTTAKYEDTFKFRPLNYTNAVLIEELDTEVDNLADAIAHSGDMFSPPSVGTGNVSRDDGSIVSGSYLHSDYIDISQFPKLLSVASYDGAFNAFYRADKSFIAPFGITAGTDKIIEIPDGAMYMRLSQSSSKYADTMHFRTLEYVTSDALPDYWFGNVAAKCDAVRGHMNSIGKVGDTFVFATDVHWYRNQQMSPKLIRYLLGHLNIGMVALGGDLITQGTKAEEIVEAVKVVKAFKFTDIFTPIAFGNHDNDSNQSDPTQRFDASTIYSLFFKGFEDSVTFMTDTEFSFYFDKAANKTRYIFLDMGDDGVSKAFTPFAEFRDTLNSTLSGYKIVIVAHIIDYGTFTTSLSQMIDAYNARTTVTVNSVVCDFTSASGTILLCLGGHRHYDDAIATPGGVPITVTDCDAMLSTTSQTAGTMTEQCFDVVSVDYTNTIAYYERVGRGESRIIHLTAATAPTTLTTSLTGTITWSSGDNSVATVSNGAVTKAGTGTTTIKADNGTTAEIWVVK